MYLEQKLSVNAYHALQDSIVLNKASLLLMAYATQASTAFLEPLFLTQLMAPQELSARKEVSANTAQSELKNALQALTMTRPKGRLKLTV